MCVLLQLSFVRVVWCECVCGYLLWSNVVVSLIQLHVLIFMSVCVC